MLEILQYTFVQNALAALLLASVACGVVGSFVVVKRISYIAGGIAHISFGGIGLGYFLGLDPVLVATPFSAASAVGIGLLNRFTKLGEDIAIGMLWAMGMALGVLLIYLTPGYAPDLFSYLFGNVLAVPQSDLWVMLALDAIIVASVAAFFEHFKAVSFDETFAEVRGISASAFYLFLLVLVALSVILLIKTIGVILVIAYLTIPAAIGRQFTHNLWRLMALSAFIGAFFGLAGFAFSYFFDLPTGATIVMAMGVGFAAISLARRAVAPKSRAAAVRAQ